MRPLAGLLALVLASGCLGGGQDGGEGGAGASQDRAAAGHFPDRLPSGWSYAERPHEARFGDWEDFGAEPATTWAARLASGGDEGTVQVLVYASRTDAQEAAGRVERYGCDEDDMLHALAGPDALVLVGAVLDGGAEAPSRTQRAGLAQVRDRIHEETGDRILC